MVRQSIRYVRPVLALLLVLGVLLGGPVAPAGAATCTVTSTGDSGAGTLRQKLADATCSSITFQAGLGPVGVATFLLINRAVTIEGAGQVVQHVGATSGNSNIFYVIDGTAVLRGLTIKGGRTDGSPGAGMQILGGNVTLDGVTLRDNIATNAGGGAIYVSDATLRLTNTIVRDNTAVGGGGLFVDDNYGTVTVTLEGGSQIFGNRAPKNAGGGIRVWHRAQYQTATLTLTNVTVSGNSADIGGGLFNQDSTATLTNTSISDNTAVTGGGIYNSYATATLTNVSISGNTAANMGGGLFTSSSTVTLTNATVSGNSAVFRGGGLAMDQGTVTLTNTTVSSNSADRGGGLYNQDGTATLSFVTLSSNTATMRGGGLDAEYDDHSPTTRLSRSVVVGNTSPAGADCNTSYNQSQGYNVVGNGTGCPANGTGDAVHTGALSALLDPTLADNGGPTRTHNLVPSSAARDRVPAGQCAITTDQRGVSRPQNGACDSGAVEYIAEATLAVAANGTGMVGRNPAGAGGGPFAYPFGTVVGLTPQPGGGQTFVGWRVDGAYKGWASPLALSMNANHTVQATFAPTVTFPDVGNGRADHAAIVALASRGTIRGYANGNYGPDDGVQRAQMAALLARATSNGPGTPPTTLTPPACLVSGTWDCEVWGTNFTDQSSLDGNLWRNVGTLQHYQVAFGYDGAACASRGVASPCYGPTEAVSYAQTITFITRMMRTKGYWLAQPGAPLPYDGVPGPHAEDVRTFAYYTGGVPTPPADWNAGATRGWFAMALWAALNTYWGTDGNLPDGRPAGGMVP